MSDSQSQRLVVSELMDGELDDDAMLALIAKLDQDEDALECWHEFHMIGDAMRDTPVLSADFNDRFSALLAAEPTVLAPQPKVKKATPISYYLMPLAASFAGVGVVSWLALGSLNGANPEGTPGANRVVQLESPPVVVRAELRHDAVRDYLAAHREFSNGAPMQLAADIRPVAATQDYHR